jgi:hypothetical protein
MENATIVTLGTPTNTSVVSNFEEAFGEFSEARGRGRNRRQKRAMDRISKRRERKKSRQEIRAEQQEARQMRKDTRKSRRVTRKAMGDEPEVEEQDTAPTTTPNDAISNDSQGGNALPPEQSQGGSDSGSGSQDSGSGDSGYQDSGSQEEWGGSAPQGQGWDEGSIDDSSGESGDYSGDDSEDESGFDGLIATEDYFSEFNDEGRVRVTPKVKELTKKIEWNKAVISALKQKRSLALKEGSQEKVADIDSRIFGHAQRIQELESNLSTYSNATGTKSHREIKKGKAMARKNLKMDMRNHRRAKESLKYGKSMLKRGHGGSETPVEADLNPSFSRNRIVVDAEDKSRATGTGLNGLDLQNDFDAPEARYIELTSNIEGDKKKINWTGIAIGVVVAGAIIWGLKKYKVFGK